MGKKWLPLESNPEVLNDFVSKLGFDTSSYAFCDVFGLDEVTNGVRGNTFEECQCPMLNCACLSSALQELLQMLPQPVVAVLFLFPVTKESEAAKDAGMPRFELHAACCYLHVQVSSCSAQAKVESHRCTLT